MTRIVLLVGLVAAVWAVEGIADAQHCTQGSPGVAEVSTDGAAISINLAAGSVPKVNGASCGFAATAIHVVGAPGKDTVTLNYVPPSVPVAMDLGAGVNNVVIDGTNGPDTMACASTGVDRDGDSTDDVGFGATAVSLLTINGRNGDDVVDCSAAGYKLKLVGGAGDDAIDGGPFNDTLSGGTGADTLDGHGGNDSVAGNEDDDIVAGGDGNDTLENVKVFDGHDTFSGGAGSDTLAYSARTTPVIAGGASSEDSIADDIETIKGGKGDDTLDFSGAALGHHLYGGIGNDVLRGGAGADKLYGEAGSDQLVPGGAKDSVIDAGDGDDTLGPTVDGLAETILCGAGTDHIVPNPEDTFKDCETADPGAGYVRQIATSGGHSCAILLNDTVKCWGQNDVGQLGLGDTSFRGNAPGQMGDALPTVDLGTGRTAVMIAVGGWHSCAVLDNGAVKCWGFNLSGELGLGDASFRGDQPGEMGNALPAVNLGTGRTAKKIAAGDDTTCAILDNNSVKCWGFAEDGVLGLADGSTATRGDGPGEMGDALPAVNLGSGRTALAIDASTYTTCAVLDNGAAKCWGRNVFGNLGQGDVVNRGLGIGTMGNALPPINLGTGRTAIAIGTGMQYACALLDNHSVKCWGGSHRGEVGLGDNTEHGDAPGEMGDALLAIDFGPGRTATALAVGNESACVLLDDTSTKCWGYNNNGGLGQGDTQTRGDQPGEMGAALPPISLGTSRRAVQVDIGAMHACAKLDDSTLKCWGEGAELGLGGTASRGDQPNEMGDKLPLVDLGHVSGFAEPAGDGGDGEPPELADADDDIDPAVDGCAVTRGGSAMSVLLALLVMSRRRRPRENRSAH